MHGIRALSTMFFRCMTGTIGSVPPVAIESMTADVDGCVRGSSSTRCWKELVVAAQAQARPRRVQAPHTRPSRPHTHNHAAVSCTESSPAGSGADAIAEK